VIALVMSGAMIQAALGFGDWNPCGTPLCTICEDAALWNHQRDVSVMAALLRLCQWPRALPDHSGAARASIDPVSFEVGIGLIE